MARDSFLLRTDPQTMAALRKWADDELRSVNGQIEFVLRRALRESGRLSEVGVIRPATPADPLDPGVARDAAPGAVAGPATGRAADAADANAGSEAASRSGGG